MLHVTAAKYLGGYRIWLSFSDGTCGEADLASYLTGPAFEPLKDQELFRQVAFDREAHTIVWPNGADLAPEFLHELAVGSANVSSNAAQS